VCDPSRGPVKHVPHTTGPSKPIKALKRRTLSPGRTLTTHTTHITRIFRRVADSFRYPAPLVRIVRLVRVFSGALAIDFLPRQTLFALIVLFAHFFLALRQSASVSGRTH
jgi:hypothetical protein